MILIFDKNAFSLMSNTQFLDENGDVLYWCEYDFSYKRRMRIHSKDNYEAGYVQYQSLKDKDEIGFFDKDDKSLGCISQVENLSQPIIEEPDNWQLIGDLDEWVFNVTDENGNEIMNVEKKDEKYKISIRNDDNAIKCIMYILAVADIHELEK